MKKVTRSGAGDRLHNRLVVLLLIAYDVRYAGLPAPVMAVLRAVYRLTPLKR